ncbi:hypothetical protein G6F56_012022 [Rhizopus delemar]|nr:hypothetical protein G6F56_012022 [Rhizopus delemar]
MNSFQTNLLEIERTQLTQKKQYEDEITRLRQQIDSRMPSSLPPQPLLPTAQPSIGPGSNHFASLMGQQPPQPVPPPPQPQPPVAAIAPVPPQGLPERSPSQPSPYPPPYLNGQFTNRPMARPDWNNYGYRASVPPPPPPEALSAKRKSNSSSSSLPPMPRPVSAKISSPVVQNLVEYDPEKVPANMKVEGTDWFALFNPKIPRQLKVDLVHTVEHKSVVCCVKFSADGLFMATGCNHATFIYDVATSQRVA